MAPNATADPQATSYTVELLNRFWKAGSAGAPVPWSGATLSHLDIADNTSNILGGDWNQYLLTTGKYPAIMSIYEPWVCALNPYAFNAFGVNVSSLSWYQILPSMILHAQRGGAVMLSGQGPYYSNPCVYQTGSTVPTATTVAAVNAAGTLTLASGTPFGSTSVFGGIIVCDDSGGGGVTTQAHSIAWTGKSGNVLSGVTISGYSGASVATNASVSPGAVGAYSTALPSGAQTGAWPLQWSASAYSTLGVGASTDYAAAQALNSNGNLNAILDSYVSLAQSLAAYQIPLILRMFLEKDNSGAAWFCLLSWFPQLWKYCVGYITGNGGFSGQPVSSTPVHNVLFCFAQSATSTTNVNASSWVQNMPAGSLVDLLGADVYTKTALATLPALARTNLGNVSGYSNIPSGCSEFYGQTVGNATATCYYGGASVDFSTLSSGNTILGITNSTFANTTFSSSGSVYCATTKGVQLVGYSARSVSGASVTFTVSSVVGVPSGSDSLTGGTLGIMVQADTTVAAAATALTDINVSSGISGNLYPAFFVNWASSDGLSMLYQASPTNLMVGSGVQQLPAIGKPGLIPAMC